MALIVYIGFMVLGFNAKINFEKHELSPEILAKMSQNMQVWFGALDFGTF